MPLRLQPGLIAFAAATFAAGGPVQAQSTPAPATQTPSSAPTSDAKAATTVQGVTVTSDKPAVRLDIDRRSYDISKDLQTQSGASIADALRNIPSVDVDVEGKVTLRGQAGVTILVDGKPSPMINADTIQNLPADQFERVEVMTNPSAAFSPEGSAGIINLVTKKRTPPGRQAILKFAYASPDRWHGGGYGSVKSGPVTVSLNANANRGAGATNGSGEGRSIDPANGVETSAANRSARVYSSHSENGGSTVRWDIDPKSQFTVAMFGYEISGRSHVDTTTTLSNSAGDVTEILSTATNGLSHTDGLHGGVEYRRDFAGDDHNLTVDLGLDRRDTSFQTTTTNVFNAASDSFQHLRTAEAQQNMDFSGDYDRPMPFGAKLKAGWDIAKVDDLHTNAGFVNGASPDAPDDPARADRYHFKRTVSAAYLTYQQPIGKLTAMPGLRVEGEDLDIDDLSTSTDVRERDVHLYPTLHLLYALTDSGSLFANYSERIDRPDPNSLNPFLAIYGPLSESQGNPHLKPEQTQDFETGWQYSKGGTSLIATAYYKLNTGGFASINTDIGGGVSLTTEQNLTRSRDAGFELAASGRLPHGFSYNLSGVYHWNEIDGSPLDFTLTRRGSTVSGKATINWQADPADYLQFNLSAAGRNFTPQAYTAPRPVINLGYRRKIDDHLSVLATALDVFQTGGQRGVTDSPLLNGHSNYNIRDRAFFLSLVLTFGGNNRRPPDFDYNGGSQ
ncbi:MAG TPA: outer membrane beta-barrel family protein [Caulobacteraceae bacterium]|nr:outer membrane beta-barrel family protein [Caulobacteraceae bacterium]